MGKIAAIDNIIVSGIVALALMCIVVVIFFERRSPASAIAWILVLSFLPLAGFVAYLFLGSGFRVNKKRKFALKAAADKFYNRLVLKHLALGHTPRSSIRNKNPGQFRLLKYLTREGGSPYTSDNQVEVFTRGGPMFDSMMNDISRARQQIHLLYFIIRGDSLGREMAALLAEKARQGLKVRVLYDRLGSFLSAGALFKDLRRAGGQVEAFLPIKSTFSVHLRLNYRNHRKITVIDGRVAYLGGMNIGNEYRGRGKRLRPWRDTHLRITGSSVWFLQERFLMDWGYASGRKMEASDMTALFPAPIKNGFQGLQIVSSGPDRPESLIKGGLLEMIYHARKYVYLQTPYFVPDESFLEALKIAALAGVDIRIMIPGLGDHFMVRQATLGYARDLLQAGGRVFMYQGFIHAKAVISDGRLASIGTANLTNRSFNVNFEVNAFIYDHNFVKEYEDIFRADQASCQELTADWFQRRPALVRGLYNSARLFAPLM